MLRKEVKIMEFRYVIKGKAYAWQKCGNVSVAKMKYVAESLTEQFGNDWNIEYRTGEQQ